MGIDVAATGKVIVVTGVGGMGRAIARRMGAGATLLLADCDEAGLRLAADALRSEGYDVVDQQTDVSDGEAVRKLAQRAVELGRPEVVVHTAGVAPARASVDAILRVDLLGTALMLEVFGEAIAFGGAGVFIASMAGTMAPSNPNLDELLAKTPALELLDRDELSMDVIRDPETAYMIAKRGNQVRVRSAAKAWGKRGARVNSISPGVVSTSMGAAELQGSNGEVIRSMVASSPTGRIGTANEIAAAVDFLASSQASYITGADLLVDGGVVAAVLG